MSGKVILGREIERRMEFWDRDLESGLIWVIENETQYSADIGCSWAESGEQWIRYYEPLDPANISLDGGPFYRCDLAGRGMGLR